MLKALLYIKILYKVKFCLYFIPLLMNLIYSYNTIRLVLYSLERFMLQTGPNIPNRISPVIVWKNSGIFSSARGVRITQENNSKISLEYVTRGVFSRFIAFLARTFSIKSHIDYGAKHFQNTNIKSKEFTSIPENWSKRIVKDVALFLDDSQFQATDKSLDTLIDRVSSLFSQQISNFPVPSQSANVERSVAHLSSGPLKEEYQLIQDRFSKAMERQKNDPAAVKARTRLKERAIAQLGETAHMAARFGNKTANLQRLSAILGDENDVEIPRFMGISHQEVQAFIQKKFPQFNDLWNQFTQHITKGGSIESALPILHSIQEGIVKAFATTSTFPSPAIEEFAKTKSKLMVRSTGREDTLKVANPGGNESIANVSPKGRDICVEMGKVVSSYFSTKSLGQRAESGDNICEAPFMPVLLQVMIGETEGNIPISGVMFTAENSMGTEGAVQMSAGFGHADGVVTGTIPTDVYYCQGDFIHGIVREKPERRAPGKNGELRTVSNPSHLRKAACLNQAQIKRLAEIGNKLQEHYGYPLDIEWTYDPKVNKFYVVQARPIPMVAQSQPTHISPEAIKQLHDVEQVTVVVGGQGRVLNLNSGNVLDAPSAKEALDKYLENRAHPPAAVFLAEPTAPNSHEAGFFKQRGIPVIYLPGQQFKQLNKALIIDSVIIDIQQGFAAKLPKGRKVEEFTVDGLRRHLAPKMESAIIGTPPQSNEAFIESLEAQAKQFDRNKLKLGFGWNLLDSMLNSFEDANSLEERAYILAGLIRIIDRRLLSKVPQQERNEIRNKIFYNAQHVFQAYNDPDADLLNRKLAMNWLRSSILQQHQADVIGSGTLISTLGGVKERRLLGMPEAPKGKMSEHQALLDIFKRSEKFILLPEYRKDWHTFIGQLNTEQLQRLDVIFKQLGPKVVETFLNSVFPNTWKKRSLNPNRANECLLSFEQLFKTDNMRKAMEIQTKGLMAARQFGALAGEFADPKQFDTLLGRLDRHLLPMIHECIQAMKEAQGFESTPLSQTLQLMISSLDDCIKGLSDSKNYKNNDAIKAERFASMLDRYLKILDQMLVPEILTDPALWTQGKRLKAFLPKRLARLKEEMKAKPANSLLPSSWFSVAMAALGSGMGAPDRAMPGSLVDIFTQIHQSIITANQSVALRSGIQQIHLPQQLFQLSLKLSSLNLHTEIRPTIQSIIYEYPNIKIYYNAPLNFHSAQFVVTAKMDPTGKLVSAEFEGRFFSPMNSIGLSGRDNYLQCMSLETYYSRSRRMRPPEDFDFTLSDYGVTQFKWNMPLEGSQFNQSVQHATGYLQNMIDFLQQPLTYQYPFELNPEMFREQPWSISLFQDQLQNADNRETIFEQAVKGLIENLNPKNLSGFLAVFRKTMKACRDYRQIATLVDRIIENDAIWEDPSRLERVFDFFSYINPDSKQFKKYLFEDEKAHVRKITEANIFTAERSAKIIQRLLKTPQTIPIIKYEDRFYEDHRKEIYEDFGLVQAA